ncbi:MAG: phosphoglycerate dehydrogenase [Proteobacteria bacterium]|nr:phosphoglycerate dehydrogenase [Pseudomonadota bacterium]
MKILVADKLADSAITALNELGAEVIVNTNLTEETLPDQIDDVEVLIVRSTKVQRDTIEKSSSLSLIIRAGAGVNNIDIESANYRGIHVSNTPGKNNIAVAELTIGLMLAADRHIVDASREMRKGVWQKKKYGVSRGLKGRTLGIIGLGAIGQAVAKRALGMEMKIVTYTTRRSVEEVENMGISMCASMDELARISDVVTHHIPSSSGTRGLFNRKFFDKMKDGAIFINTSRGDTVDTEDLIAAINKKGLKVGLDVYENEPAGSVASFYNQGLAELITCTPHIGASTDQSTEAVATEVVRIVSAYMKTGKPLNSVNIRKNTENAINLVVRHNNTVGALAGVLDKIKSENINIEEMENTIFASGKSASCSLRLDGKPSQILLDKLIANKEVIQIMLK